MDTLSFLLLPEKDLAFLFEFHEMAVDTFLQPADFPLNGNKPISYINPCSEFCIVCELAKVTVNPVTEVTNEDAK